MRRGEPIDEGVARLLQNLRKKAGLTLAAVAARAGISANTVSSLELGRRPTRAVSVSVAYRLAEALGVDPARLLLAMGSGDAEAGADRRPELDVASVPVAMLPAEHSYDWDPWKSASSELRYAVPRSVVSHWASGVVVKWAEGSPAPLVSVAARSYLGRMAPGWVAYLHPAPMLEDVYEDEGGASRDVEYPDMLDVFSQGGVALVSWPEGLGVVTVSEVWQDYRYDSGYDLEGYGPARPESQRYIGRIRWWAPR